MKTLLIYTSAFVCAASVSFALTASDNAADPAYNDGWTGNGTDGFDNGGTGFNGWGFTTNAGDIAEISSSTAGAGNIDTSGGSFRIASDGGSLDVFRSFAGNASLGAGDVFTFDLTLNFRNGAKGFDLRDAGTEVFNFNVAGDQYFFGGVNLSDPGGENWQYVSDAIYGLEFEFVTETVLNARISRNSTTFGVEQFELLNVAVSEVDNFKFYVSGTDDSSPNNSLYVNNLEVVPEPGAFALITGLFAITWLLRRQRR